MEYGQWSLHFNRRQTKLCQKKRSLFKNFVFLISWLKNFMVQSGFSTLITIIIKTSRRKKVFHKNIREFTIFITTAKQQTKKISISTQLWLWFIKNIEYILFLSNILWPSSSSLFRKIIFQFSFFLFFLTINSKIIAFIYSFVIIIL